MLFRPSENGKPFEATIKIPELIIDADYSSSGVLIILPASGNGTFHAQCGKVKLQGTSNTCKTSLILILEDITATVQGTMSTNIKQGVKYLHVEKLYLDLDFRKVRMGVKKVFRNNRILSKIK